MHQPRERGEHPGTMSPAESHTPILSEKALKKVTRETSACGQDKEKAAADQRRAVGRGGKRTSWQGQNVSMHYHIGSLSPQGQDDVRNQMAPSPPPRPGHHVPSLLALHPGTRGKRKSPEGLKFRFSPPGGMGLQDRYRKQFKGGDTGTCQLRCY